MTRLSLAQRLALLLATLASLAVLAMALLLSWNLRGGFGDYLAARDAERLHAFAAHVSEILSQPDGAVGFQDAADIHLGELLRRFEISRGWRLPGGPPPGDRPVPNRPPPPGSRGEMDSLGTRIALLSTDGRLLKGNALPDQGVPYLEEPLIVEGTTVATLRLLPSRVPDAVDARFLRSQYLGIAGLAVSLALIASMLGWWMGRRWTKPLLAVRDAATRIARGDRNVRIESGRQDEIGDVIHGINHMVSALQALETTRRSWLANIAHELRTPVTVLRGEIESLLDNLRPIGKESLQSLKEEILRLSAVIDDLHQLALADLDALPCRLEQLDTAPLLQELPQRFAIQIANRGLTLHISCPTEQAFIHGDPARIRQLLGNLLTNSLAYTDAPGLISVDLKQDDSQIQIDIEDSAPGVSDTDLHRLFEPLFRVDAERSRDTGGSGLGLAISLAIVQAHCGSLEALQGRRGGLHLRIRFPIWRAPHP
jgi:two-component system, OmpR family, sensor histidine kinase BaeS